MSARPTFKHREAAASVALDRDSGEQNELLQRRLAALAAMQRLRDAQASVFLDQSECHTCCDECGADTEGTT